MDNSNIRKERITGLLKTIAVPLIIWGILEIIVRSVAGVGILRNSADFKILFRNLVSSLAFALAIGTNLNCGRMDLSLGAQMYAGVIFGGNFALNMGWGGIGILICSMIVGGICGFIIGFLFVNMRILPMVLGLGMTLVFECSCFAVNNQQGVMLFGKPGVEILSNLTFITSIVVVLILAATYLFQFSTYGFRYRAIQGSQKLAADAGINIYTNCVICYLLAGVLAACAGVFITAFAGKLDPVLGMSSNGNVFSNMFPMVLGLWIGSFCNNQQVGILMGALSVNILILALSKMGIGTNDQNVIIYSLFLIFTVYNSNKSKIAYGRAKRRRIAEARAVA